MHPNPAFRKADDDRALTDAASRSFGALTVVVEDQVIAAHVPFLLTGHRIASHLVRSNPIARHLMKSGSSKALMIVSGPDGYISPDWYGEEQLVPTWNYVALHLRGTVTALEPDRLRSHLDELSERFEATLAPKPPWTMDKMDDTIIDKLMRTITPVEMIIETVESTYKLNQNRTDSARFAAAAEVERAPLGHNQVDLARLMRSLPDR